MQTYQNPQNLLKQKKVSPDRHFNIGIAEANMMGIAAGLATCGNTVFASTFAMLQQVVHTANPKIQSVIQT